MDCTVPVGHFQGAVKCAVGVLFWSVEVMLAVIMVGLFTVM